MTAKAAEERDGSPPHFFQMNLLENGVDLIAGLDISSRAGATLPIDWFRWERKLNLFGIGMR